MNTKALQDLGLTKNEIKVYIALLELGSTTAGPLVKKLGMHRAAVYNLLDLLIDKGLVSYVKQAERKYFEAQDPDRLLEYVDTKRKEIEQLLPDLQLKKKLSQETQENTTYKGKKGLKSIFEDILKENPQEWLVYGAMGGFKQLLPFYFIHHHKRRAKQGIKVKIIYNEEVRKEKRTFPLMHIKYLPSEYITPSTTYVYNNKVVIIQWTDEPLGFMIKSKSVADSHRSFFNLLWKQAEK